MNFAKVFPILTSIVILLLVAVWRDRSRTVAAILSTMPINMVLSIWLISSADNADSQAMLAFLRSLMVGLIPGFLWLLVIYFLARAGWNLWGAIVSAYLVWGGLIMLALWWGVLAVKAD